MDVCTLNLLDFVFFVKKREEERVGRIWPESVQEDEVSPAGSLFVSKFCMKSKVCDVDFSSTAEITKLPCNLSMQELLSI